MKKVIILSSYPSNELKTKILSDCIDSIKKLNFDIFLVSHLPVSKEIQDKIDYFIYDRDNTLLPENMSLFTWFTIGDSKFIINKKGHELTISKNMFNSISLVNALKYDLFLFSESDNIFSDNDVKKIENLFDRMVSDNKKMIFFEPCDFYESGSHVYETLLFGGSPNYFLSKINLPTTVSDWLVSGVKTTFERFFFDSFSEYSSDFLIVPEHSSQLLSESRINIFRNDTFVCDLVYNKTNINTVCFVIKNIINHDHEKRIIIKRNGMVIDDKIIVNGYWEYRLFNLDDSEITITYLIDGVLQSVKEYKLSKENLKLFKSNGYMLQDNNEKMIDVICLTNTKNDELYKMTVNCLKSLHNSEDDYKFNVHLIESNNDSDYSFSDLSNNYYSPKIDFNYNKFLNLCNDFLNSEWIVIINNDLIFEKNWFSNIMNIHNLENDIKSFSPKDPYHFGKYFPGYFNDKNLTHVLGYNISEHIHGWCLVLHKTVWDSIYPFDDTFHMYYQDNDYSETIKSKGFKHSLVRDSIVHHLGSKTTLTPFGINDDEIKKSELTFRTKWNIF